MIHTDVKYSKAFSEVYFIINSLDRSVYTLIPNTFIKLIEDNMDRDYVVTREHINTVGMLPETKAILSLMYRDFFISDSARDELIEADKEELRREEKRYENIFQKKADGENEKLKDPAKDTLVKEHSAKDGEEKVQKNTQLVVQKPEKWYRKIYNGFLKAFENLFKGHHRN
ncbi:MAG: hypothetical protein IKD77_00615 [Bacilli bacterium]|nr:hypothetical protein [Bacilli bacterium]